MHNAKKHKVNSKMQLIKDFAEKGLELEVPEKFVENNVHIHKKCWDSMRYEVKKIPKRDHSVGPSELANEPSAKRRLVLADNIAEGLHEDNNNCTSFDRNENLIEDLYHIENNLYEDENLVDFSILTKNEILIEVD